MIWDASPAVTYEGDNTVMAQQSARYIFKQVSNVMKGNKCVGVFSYLNEVDYLLKSGLKCSVTAPEDFLSLKLIDEALKVNVCFIVFTLSQ
jgi:hypothetical protein